MEEKFLPVGTVVMLQNGSKPVMVCGYAIVDAENTAKVYDYMGSLYPEGIISIENSLVFNHDQIKEVVFKGLVNDDYTKFNEELIKARSPKKAYDTEKDIAAEAAASIADDVPAMPGDALVTPATDEEVPVPTIEAVEPKVEEAPSVPTVDTFGEAPTAAPIELTPIVVEEDPVEEEIPDANAIPTIDTSVASLQSEVPPVVEPIAAPIVEPVVEEVSQPTPEISVDIEPQPTDIFAEAPTVAPVETEPVQADNTVSVSADGAIEF